MLSWQLIMRAAFVPGALCGLLLIAFPALAQDDPYPICELQPVFGCETYMTKAMKESARRLGEAIAKKLILEADLAATRQNLERACHNDPSLRDHPERSPVMQHLTELLDIKDAYFIRVQYDVLGWGPSMREHNEAVDVLTSGGRPFDGGQRPDAAWQDFINAENEQAKGRAMDFSGILANAVDANNFQTNQRYRRFLVSRNLLEVNSAGCNITADANLLWQDGLLIDQPWKPYTRVPDDPENVRQYFAGAVKLFGELALRGAAQTTLAMPKSAEGQYRLPDGYQTGLMDALLYALEVQSDRAYARKALLTWEHTFKLDRFEQARQVEAMLSAAYGDAAIDRAGHVVRTAPRTSDGHISGFGPGWRGVYVRPAVFDALAKGDPRGYVRAILAFEKHLTDKSAVDTAYAQLVATHGAAAVDNAGASLLALWAAPGASVSPAERQSDAYRRHLNGADPAADAPLLYARLG